ncbi:MAG: metallophosphoesterase family protein [Halobacteriaceae archaeon]
MQVALIADSHIPTRADSIPETFRDRIAAADHVIHAGDFETAETLAEVRRLAEGLTAVHGNADPGSIALPSVASLEIDAVNIVVTHGNTNHVQAAVETHGSVMSESDWQAAIADTARARTRAWDSDGPLIGVGGHTHEVVDTRFEDVRLLNPGSVTGAAPAERATMQTLTVDGASVDVSLHEAQSPRR